MPATSLFDTNTTLIGSRSLANCPEITDLSINSTIFPNTPLVFNISPLQDCSQNLFTSDPYLKNTNGCCVLDTSAQTCTGVAGIAGAEESSYYMGVRYYDAITAIGREKGERKLCYTAPISRKKLEIELQKMAKKLEAAEKENHEVTKKLEASQSILLRMAQEHPNGISNHFNLLSSINIIYSKPISQFNSQFQ